MPYIPRDTKTLLQSMAARVIARTELTDLSEGSVLLQILASMAEELNSSEIRLKRVRDSFFMRNVSSTELDERANEMPPKGLTRRLQTNAQGPVLTVTREDKTSAGGGEMWEDPLVLPGGTVFRRKDDLSQTYLTTEDVTFAGSPGVGLPGVGILTNVYCRAVQSGLKGNCNSNTITDILSAPPDIIAVTNATQLQNGVESETDEQLKNRITAYLSSLARCQPIALEYCALKFEDPNGTRAIFASCYEDPAHRGYSELVIDDGSGLEGNVAIGQTSQGTVPTHGQAVLYHHTPATAPISEITITRAGVPVVYKHADGDYISIQERGLVYFPPEVLQPGDEWIIEGFEVYTNLIANLQSVIEGSTSDPVNNPGWRAAGTRVVVRPARIELLAMDVHVIPQQYISLSEIAGEIRKECVGFAKRLAPGETFYVSQLIDKLMNNPKLISLRIYETGSAMFKEDDPAPTYDTAWRIDATGINIVPAVED